jgi:hypothetical protein
MENDRETSSESKNQFVHRLIPTVTAVGLTLGAGACGGSDGPEDDGPDNSGPELPTEEERRRYCSVFESCVSDANFAFDSVDDCASYLEDRIRYYTDTSNSNVDQACSDAGLDYFNCAVDEVTCDMGNFVYGMQACESEFDATVDACNIDE